jgi:acetoacetate decarboxylase
MFRFSDDLCYQMPVHFGGYGFEETRLYYDDATAIVIGYETDPEMLARYIPEGFEIAQPVINIGYVMCRGVRWMAGGHYNLVAVQVPVTYTQSRDGLEGGYVLVVWENKACPMLGGREQTGIPKLFANIEDHHQLGDRVFTNLSYEGTAFLRIDFQKTKSMTADDLVVMNQQQSRSNWLGWRYIPNLGRPGAALSHATLYPIDYSYSAGWQGEGRVRWEIPTWEQNPNQANIIKSLGELPIKAYLGCTMTHQRQVMRVDLARQLP